MKTYKNPVLIPLCTQLFNNIFNPIIKSSHLLICVKPMFTVFNYGERCPVFFGKFRNGIF